MVMKLIATDMPSENRTVSRIRHRGITEEQ